MQFPLDCRFYWQSAPDPRNWVGHHIQIFRKNPLILEYHQPRDFYSCHFCICQTRIRRCCNASKYSLNNQCSISLLNHSERNQLTATQNNEHVTTALSTNAASDAFGTINVRLLHGTNRNRNQYSYFFIVEPVRTATTTPMLQDGLKQAGSKLY